MAAAGPGAHAGVSPAQAVLVARPPGSPGEGICVSKVTISRLGKAWSTLSLLNYGACVQTRSPADWAWRLFQV